MKVSVITLSYNNAEYITNCIQALKNQTFRDLEIIGVDNNSSDNSVELFKKFGIKVIENHKNYGGCTGLNIGMRASNSEYIALIDIDTIAHKSWLENLVKYMDSHPEVGAAMGKIIQMGTNKINSGGNISNYLGHVWCEGMGEEDRGQFKTRQINNVSGASFFVRKSVLDEVGYYDDDFFLYSEDSDLSWRIRLANYKLAFVQDALLYHRYTVSLDTNTKHYFVERNRLATILKNYSSRTIFLILPVLLFDESCILFGYAIFNGLFFKKIAGYIWNLKIIGKTLYKRKAIQAIRKISDKEIVRTFKGNFEHPEIKSVLISYILNPITSFYWRCINWAIR